MITLHHAVANHSSRNCVVTQHYHRRAAVGSHNNNTSHYEDMIMKTLLSALLALSFLTGVAASANAFDTQSFYEQLDRSRQ